jgi:RNA polymerase sigma-70 factor, ECF subfamily
VTKERKSAADKEQFLHQALVHVDHLYRVAFHLVAKADEADDLVQEAYTRAIASFEQFNLGSNMRAWLTKILYNLFFDGCHEKKRWVSIDDDFAAGTEAMGYSELVPTANPGPENYALLRELNSKISEGMRKLPEEFRMPIVLVDMEDFSYAEAAEVLSCPIGTIRSRISRGRQLLHKHLKGYVGKGTK